MGRARDQVEIRVKGSDLECLSFFRIHNHHLRGRRGRVVVLLYMCYCGHQKQVLYSLALVGGEEDLIVVLIMLDLTLSCRIGVVCLLFLV